MHETRTWITVASALCLTAAVGCGGSSAQSNPQAVDEERIAERAADIVEERLEQRREAERRQAAAVEGVAEMAGRGVERYEVPVSGDRPVRGAGEPLVTIVEFGNFECPFSARVTGTLDRLLGEHPDTVQLVFRNNPLPMHTMAPLAHEAALEARAQGGDEKFWQMHDLLFANQDALSRADLEGYGRQLGLDMQAYRQALDDREHRAVVERDQQLAQEVGARGTPHFFINGRRMGGAQPYEDFEEIVADEIERARELMEAGVPRSQIYASFMRAAAETAPDEPARRDGRPRLDPAAVYNVPLDENMPQLGPDDALVTIVEVAGYQCPFSGRVQPTIEALRDRYGDDIRVLWLDYPLPFHEHGVPAAMAALEVFEQAGEEGFWRYHRTLFENQRRLTRENLERWAEEIPGVNMRRFRRSLDTGRHRPTIEAHQELVQSRVSVGTPSFFINGRVVQGAQPLSVFTDLIDEELRKARALVNEGTPRDRVYETIIEDGATEPQMIGGGADRGQEAERVAVRHILVQYRSATRAAPDVTRSPEQARRQADGIATRAQRGADFEDLARQHSDGPTAPRGGDLGEFPRGRMHPDFEEAAFGLEVDEVSGVVETPFGFHVIQRYR